MSLIEEIQHVACDSNCDLGALLRKCKVLAARLGSRPVVDWVLWESNGYPQKVRVPKYRMWPLTLKGHFLGPYGSKLSDAPIPLSCLPKKIRPSYQKYQCRQSIASIEKLLKGEHEGSFHVPSGDLVRHVGETVYTGLNCTHVEAVFGVGNLQEVHNAVRNRVLDFSLAVWKADPKAGSAPAKTKKGITPARVSKLFNATVYIGSLHIADTAPDARITLQVTANNIDSLKYILRENDVVDDDIADLESALNAEPYPLSTERFGPRISDWIARMMKKACEGSWSAPVNSAGTLLTEAVSRYYGLQ